MMRAFYDVIVVGGGHAGTEAAAAAARMGAATLLVTQRLDRIGELSCNPSIGGIGKGHLVREVDALDGVMGRAADLAGIHFKMLNRSKGPAVRGLRAQMDRQLYRSAVQDLLAAQSGLTLLQGEVTDLTLSPSGELAGIALASGHALGCAALVITTGTFLGGIIHIGHQQTSAGRVGEAASNRLADTIRRLGVATFRLKTGTPPRLLRSSIAWDDLPPDHGDPLPTPFSFLTAALDQPQTDCRVTGTTPATHALVQANLAASAMYGGAISGRGPRYCPSLEDKVVRFAGRDRHQIFLEPEGLPGTPDGAIIYPNGISTSLPLAVQQSLLATIPGLENAQIIRPGYAVEYDYVSPTALRPSLELRALPRLFLAGQINGTTGYEEAAGQGVLAGINAAHRASGNPALILDRASSYIGVMVDDLTQQGISEPYRMFTSRAEFRLSLRCDNADLRLTPLGLQAGCVGPARASRFCAYQEEVKQAEQTVLDDRRTPNELASLGIAIRQDGLPKTIADCLVNHNDVSLIDLAYPWFARLSAKARDHITSNALYGGYITRQAAEIRHFRASESAPIPENLDYAAIPGLGTEAGERLRAAQPTSIGALGRVQGVTPAASMAVMAYLWRQNA